MVPNSSALGFHIAAALIGVPLPLVILRSGRKICVKSGKSAFARPSLVGADAPQPALHWSALGFHIAAAPIGAPLPLENLRSD